MYPIQMQFEYNSAVTVPIHIKLSSATYTDNFFPRLSLQSSQFRTKATCMYTGAQKKGYKLICLLFYKIK